MSDGLGGDDRVRELAESLAEVRDRLDRACAEAGRDPANVRLLTVTKTFPAGDVARLADLGLADFGENKVQEAERKSAELARLRPSGRPRWHMVGQLQRNKTRSVARWASEVQSVDSIRLVAALGKGVRAAREAGERTSPMDVLVQVGLDEAAGRGGCPPRDVPALADEVARSSELRLRGLMAVAPLDASPDQAFERLAGIAQRICADHPDATEMSAGMSGDLEEAIRHGSTCVRVGTAVLGRRRLTSE